MGRPEEILEIERIVRVTANALARTFCASDPTLSFADAHQCADEELRFSIEDMGKLLWGDPEMESRPFEGHEV